MNETLNAPPVAAVEAERAVIGAMLISANALRLLDYIDDDADLATPILRTILGAIRRLVHEDAPVDPLTTLGELRRAGEAKTIGGVDDAGLLLLGLADSSPVAASAAWYCRALIEASIRRKVLEHGTRLAQFAGRASLDDLIGMLSAAVRDVTAINGRLTAVMCA